MRSKPLIVIVDDEDAFLEIASTQLAGDFDVVKAHSVPEALDAIASVSPDMVLSDVYMPPGPNGWDLALALRKDAKTRDIHFALFTSLRDPWLEFRDDRTMMMQHVGPVTILSKTDDIGRLAERVKSLM